MPSQLHEALLLLFRNGPTLAPALLGEALGVALPTFAEASVAAADLTDLQPAEYRADLVVLLSASAPVLGIVIEVQLRPDEDKRFAWPVYTTGLRARLRCPACLLVVAADEAVARWAARPIELGGGALFTPLVLGPAGVPEVTDAARARAEPELAVLSAMTHGRAADSEKALRIALAALAASIGLDAERARLYGDLTLASLSEAAREALGSMDPAKYEYQSEFARRYVAEGRAEGIAEGRAEGVAEGRAEGMAEVVLRQLALRFGPLADGVVERVRGASVGELAGFAERLLNAQSLDDVLDAT